MKIVYISRDPFARINFIKTYVCVDECDWCGLKKKLWKYGTHADGIYTKPEFSKGEFCSIGCHNNYHN